MKEVSGGRRTYRKAGGNMGRIERGWGGGKNIGKGWSKVGWEEKRLEGRLREIRG